MTDRRPFLRSLFDAAVAAARPDRVVAPGLPDPPPGRIILLAAGKAAAAMAAAAERHYLDDLDLDPARLDGLAATRRGHGVPTRRIGIVEAGHPMPDAASVAAADAALALAREAGPGDLVLVLLSGGGSANWTAPVEGVTIADKRALTRSLLRSGAPIADINAVRKHLSRIKGGRLARAAGPARVVTLAISDVPGDDPCVIASGPTVADPTTLADARAVLRRHGVAVDAAIVRALDDPRNETPKEGDPAFARASFAVVARPRDALDAAIAVATRAGYAVRDLGADLQGEAAEVGAAHARLAREALAFGRRTAILSGGELTVTVRGEGRGGPNQEYALALALALRPHPETFATIAALAADTDGGDGGTGAPGDAAGAFVDAHVMTRMTARGFDPVLDPAAALARNDSTGFFEAASGLLTTGPTLTNVNDIRVILVDP